MIKLSNFVSSCFTDCSWPGSILSPAVGRYVVVQPQVKIRGGTVTQRWRVGFIYLHSDAPLWGASVGTGPSGSIYSSLYLGGKQALPRVTHPGLTVCLGQRVVLLRGDRLRHRPRAAGRAAPVCMASSSQGGLADTPGLIALAWGIAEANYQLRPVRGHPWDRCLRFTRSPCPLEAALIFNPHFLAWIWEG